MTNIVWKAFKLGELFIFKNERDHTIAVKNIDKSDIRDDFYNVSVVTESMFNNGVGFYMNENDPIVLSRLREPGMTCGSQFGNVNFQEKKYICIGNIYSIFEKDSNFKRVLDTSKITYNFISNSINKVMNKSGIYGYMYKSTTKQYEREIILLPLIEVKGTEEYIWEENGKFWTLAVDYIKELMNEAKYRKEEKTIKLYEAEREKYEAEREKYEADYFKEQSSLVWKSFKLEDLFKTSTEHYLEKSKKNYNISDTKSEEFCIAVCAASKLNNGIVGYIAEVDDVPQKKRKGFITKGGFGHCFYQSDWFIKPGGSWGMLDIIKIKNNKFKKILDLEINCYYFLAKSLTKIFTSMASWGYAVPFNREIILLPVLEVKENEEYIWEENGKFWTLAINTVSYLYLQGQVNIQQRKIDTYTYKY